MGPAWGRHEEGKLMDIDQQKANDDTMRVILSELSTPFDPSLKKQRQVSGPQGPRMLDYYDLMTVVDRLNDVAPGWCSTVKNQEVIPFGQTNRGDNRLMLTALVALSIPGVGTREHMGVQVVNADSSGEDLWKGAISDGIKKAASLFGVGRELYDDVIPTLPMQEQSGQREVRQQHQAGLSQLNRPAQQPRPSGGGGGGGMISDRQIQFIHNLAYERGMAYQEVANIGGMSGTDASQMIDQLMAQNRLRPLQKGEQPPAWWYAGDQEPPF